MAKSHGTLTQWLDRHWSNLKKYIPKELASKHAGTCDLHQKIRDYHVATQCGQKCSVETAGHPCKKLQVRMKKPPVFEHRENTCISTKTDSSTIIKSIANSMRDARLVSANFHKPLVLGSSSFDFELIFFKRGTSHIHIGIVSILMCKTPG